MVRFESSFPHPLSRLFTRRPVLVALAVAVLVVVANAQPPAGPQNDVKDRHGVTCRTEMVSMRDGTRLATDLYFPATPGRHPVIMQRTPYGLGLGHGCFVGLSGEMAYWAENGYVGITQDSRGTFRSEGQFTPIFEEQADGYDAVEWAASQPWSSGRVGMTGTSYFGVTQWQAAVTAPPHLVAIAPGQTATDYHDHWTYVNGVFDLWFGQSWILNFFAPDAYRRQLIDKGMAPDAALKASEEYRAKGRTQIFTAWSRQVPLKAFEEFRSLAPYYYDWLDHPNYDDYWAKVDIETRWADIKVPAMINGGWSDLFAIGSVRSFAGMKTGGGTATARTGTKLTMVPGGHGGSGVLTFEGVEADLRGEQLRFFDRHVKGIENAIDKEPAVRLFVQIPPTAGTKGIGFWMTSESFPPAGARPIAFHLQSGGHANTRHGDGVLNVEGPPAGPPDSFVYDPLHPVQALGGGLCCTSLGSYFGAGSQDQSTLELRDDVLVYTSAPLTSDLAVIGPVKAVLWAQSSARDTDFTVKLVDVRPDGFALNVLDRIVRTRFRNGSKTKPSLPKPDTPYQYEIELGNTATVFQARHRVRLDISSSKFPHLARNPNTGGEAANESQLTKAVQTLMHDGTHPSRLELSVVVGARAGAR